MLLPCNTALARQQRRILTLLWTAVSSAECLQAVQEPQTEGWDKEPAGHYPGVLKINALIHAVILSTSAQHIFTVHLQLVVCAAETVKHCCACVAQSVQVIGAKQQLSPCCVTKSDD